MSILLYSFWTIEYTHYMQLIPLNFDLPIAATNSSAEDARAPFLLELIAREKDNLRTIESANVDSADNSASKNRFERKVIKIASKFNLAGAGLSSVLHLITAAAGLFYRNAQSNIFSPVANKINKLSFAASSVINAFIAFAGARTSDAIALLLEPVAFMFFHKDDLDIGKNFALAMSQLVIGNEPHVNKKAIGQRVGIGDFFNDIKENGQALFKSVSEIFAGGLGDDRRFFTGFTYDNLKETARQSMMNFNLYGILEAGARLVAKLNPGNIKHRYLQLLRRSGLSRIQTACVGDEDRDRGHTNILSAGSLIGSSLISLAAKRFKPLTIFAKAANYISNVLAAVNIFGHPDPKHSAVGLFLGSSSAADLIRYLFASSDKAKGILHDLSMAVYSIGSVMYLNRTIDNTRNSELSFGGSKSKFDFDAKDFDPNVARVKKVMCQERIYREDARLHPDRTYLFGDNIAQSGFGNQAVEMRGEQNSIPVPTMHTPYDDPQAYLSDMDFDENKRMIDYSFSQIPEGTEVVIPVERTEEGKWEVTIGKGFAYMKRKAFKTYSYLQEKLSELVRNSEEIIGNSLPASSQERMAPAYS